MFACNHIPFIKHIDVVVINLLGIFIFSHLLRETNIMFGLSSPTIG
jgi:hypothetical protein